MPESSFMTLDETAKYLNVSLRYIYQMSSEGRLPGKRAFGPYKIRVHRPTLDAAIAKEVMTGLKQKTSPREMGELITLKEAAKPLGLTLDYAFTMSRQSRLPGKIVLGSSIIRVHRPTLESSLNNLIQTSGFYPLLSRRDSLRQFGDTSTSCCRNVWVAVYSAVWAFRLFSVSRSRSTPK